MVSLEVDVIELLDAVPRCCRGAILLSIPWEMKGMQRAVPNPETPPYDMNVLISCRDRSGEDWWGSGAMISRKHVLTAAHVVYPLSRYTDSLGRYRITCRTAAKTSTSGKFGARGVSEVWIPPAYRPDGDATEDVAVLTLSREVTGCTLGQLTDLGVPLLKASDQVFVTGYPWRRHDLVEELRVTELWEYRAKARVEVKDKLYSISASGDASGVSGGPCWVLIGDKRPLIVGIAARQGSSSGRIGIMALDGRQFQRLDGRFGAAIERHGPRKK